MSLGLFTRARAEAWRAATRPCPQPAGRGALAAAVRRADIACSLGLGLLLALAAFYR